MKPEIKFKKVSTDGEPSYQITSFSGINHKTELPELYTRGVCYFYKCDGVFMICSNGVNDVYKVGDLVTPTCIINMENAMKTAAGVLREINQDIKKINGSNAGCWKGNVTIALEE